MVNANKRVIGVVSRGLIRPGAKKIFENNQLVYASNIKEKINEESYIKIHTSERVKNNTAQGIVNPKRKIIGIVSREKIDPTVRRLFERNKIAYTANVTV